jgi:hypothetical protein
MSALQGMPREMEPISAFSVNAELRCVGGADGRAAPPPMVAMILHFINSLHNDSVRVNSVQDVEAAKARPSWTRMLVVDTMYEPAVTAALALDGFRCIQFRKLQDEYTPAIPRSNVVKSLAFDAQNVSRRHSPSGVSITRKLS